MRPGALGTGDGLEGGINEMGQYDVSGSSQHLPPL